MVAVIPMLATAQDNIKSAFDAIIKCPKAKVTESHTLDRDVNSRVKTGQADVYNFSLPANKIKLIDIVISAFNKDADNSYSFNRGIYSSGSGEQIVSLAIGNENYKGVRIMDDDCNYMYALFLAPESDDPKGNHRYAYAMSYREENNKIVGKLVVTYATTLKYRMQGSNNSMASFNKVLELDTKDKTWFEKFMSYAQSMSSASEKTRLSLAKNMYLLIGYTDKYKDVTLDDKTTVRKILQTMLLDSKYTSDSILKTLLEQCLARLK